MCPAPARVLAQAHGRMEIPTLSGRRSGPSEEQKAENPSSSAMRCVFFGSPR